ncbi:eukaryotic translation initiation factor 4 gamma 1 [Patella vulgata]|uniref:eukaryotic translation initiation factor 4 gamma 1 n=1 Tax=Patella vulgata TaxID=6465 RepID=UPI0024A7F706|nr:eukaryotic translation initiation factor 4 gamma 1 [Patella vulgata]
MYSLAYANMSRYFIQLKVPSDSKPGEKVNFRVILLTKCQREFEKDEDVEIDLEARQKKINEADSEDVKKQLQEEMEVAATARRRSIGNIRFIGELCKLKLLPQNIMHDCVVKLLRSRDEVNLECSCRLLTTIGKELDTEKAKHRIDQYFRKMQEIVGNKKTSSRVRFILQDVIDLRLCNWVPRREDNNPKTIDKIHKKAAKENAQRTYLLSQNPPQSGGRGDFNNIMESQGNNSQPREVYRKPREMERRPPFKPRNMEDRPPLKPPSLSRLDQDGSREKWEQFEQEFDRYLVDSGLEFMDDTVKCPLLRQCIGQENMHIYDSFYTLHELKTKFSNYCKRPMRADSVNKVDGNHTVDVRQKNQRSPLNQEGRIIYDRNFLLQFSSNCVSKPKGLPNLPDIVLDKPAIMSSAERIKMGNTVLEFSPDFVLQTRPEWNKQSCYRGRYLYGGCKLMYYFITWLVYRNADYDLSVSKWVKLATIHNGCWFCLVNFNFH